MPKKKPPVSVPVNEPAKLTHNPFAGLGSSADVPSDVTAVAATVPSAKAPTAERKGRLVLARETKHRGGKAVVVIRGFDSLPRWDDSALSELASELKRALGCGGSAQNGEILVQGDRPADVAQWLRAQGFRVEGVTK